MESDRTISQWFAAMADRQRERMDLSVEKKQPIRDNVQLEDEVMHTVHDALLIWLQNHASSDGQGLSDSLSSPSPPMLTQPAQIETSDLLADVLASVTEAGTTGGPVTPYVQVAEMGAGLALYNAVFIPGWPLPPFAKNPDTTPDGGAQHARNEAEIAAYLTELGLNKDLLSKILKTFKTAVERARFLEWLSTLIAVATTTLDTFRQEATDIYADTDHDLGLPKNRGFLKI